MVDTFFQNFLTIMIDPQVRMEPPGLDWNTQHGHNYQYESAGAVYSSARTVDSDFSTEEGYEQAVYPHMGFYQREGHHGEEHGHENHTNSRKRFQVNTCNFLC